MSIQKSTEAKAKKRGSFSGNFGFVIAAAASAVGLGNIWRFPYLAAKDGGGLFLLVYLILVVTFGFALLASELAIGRSTRQGPLTAYSQVHKKFAFAGFFAFLIPAIILPYYCAIGGWVLKYLAVFVTGGGITAATDGFFTGYITSYGEPLIWMAIFIVAVMLIILKGVDAGIERMSRILMPALIVLVIGISIFSLSLSYTDAAGVTRTGLEGLAVYVIPNFNGITPGILLTTIADATSQLFFSISVAMGIMIAYSSYVKKEVNLMSSVNRIEIFDTGVAFLAGLMIIPAVFTFMGAEGMSAGPGLMFVSLPKVFEAMGVAGPIIGVLFFVLVTFAAVTSAVSIMEAVVSSVCDKFHTSRPKATIIVTIYALIIGAVVCLGYNAFYFELLLPNGSTAQVLDILDWLSNSVFMPFLALVTCILIGWVVGPKFVIDEFEQNGQFKFQRRTLFIIMVKFVCPVMLFVLLLQSFGLIVL